MPKLEVKEIPILSRRVLRQMFSGRDGIEIPNELCDCGAVRVSRRIIPQHDAQVIRASGLLAGSALPKFDGGPGRYRGRSRSRQIARDLVNLRGREAVLIVLLAAPEKTREKKANPQRGEQQCKPG